ncbi:hypothetical protein [Weissella confusa]|uniref:hypothetical protein n=1 Tax=Weissella confusa TaxID=1583 RepID=UPI0018F2057A|nr:hypothetical protein [Weissella confusa]MBJ7623931.1 hypothetical protein [Weissella confusa]MBJ7674683.1 hypothetical protein [Weissella confusa]
MEGAIMESKPHKPHGFSSLIGSLASFIPGLLSIKTTWIVVIFGAVGIVLLLSAQWLYFLIKDRLFLKRRIINLENELDAVTTNRDALIKNRENLLDDKGVLLGKIDILGKIMQQVLYQRPDLLDQANKIQQMEELLNVTDFSNSKNNR